MDVAAWLAEDVGAGDLTTLAVIDELARCQARLLLKEPHMNARADFSASRSSTGT